MEENVMLAEQMEEESLKNKYLTFAVGNEMYAIEIKYVTEIAGIEEITEMPEMPDYVRGIINLRGKIIPVIDVRLRFGKQERQYDDRTSIIIISYKENLSGLIVDKVAEVLTITPDGISELPAINSANTNSFVKKIGKKDNGIVLILSCELLIAKKELLDPEQMTTESEV